MNKYLYTEKELPQKSDNWLKFRLDKIGSSEVSILTGNFPTFWCDDYQLFLRKMGKKDDFINEHLNRGNKYEKTARKYVENYLNTFNTKENNIECYKHVYDRTNILNKKHSKFFQFTLIHREIPYIFTSFDGIDLDNKLVLELKCPSENTFKKLLKNRTPSVPKMYYDQVQTQLMIANSHYGIKRGIFGIYYNNGVEFFNKKNEKTHLIKLILIETELDEEYCENIKKICEKYIKIIKERQWNRHWNL